MSQHQHIHRDGRVHGVVVGCRNEEGRWLMIRRSQTVAAPGAVCFPGGTVELGELHTDTVIREMHEELHIEVKPVRRVLDFLHPEKPLRLFGFLAEIVSGEVTPDPDEVAEAFWLLPDEAREHPDKLNYTDRFIDALETAIATRTTPYDWV